MLASCSADDPGDKDRDGELSDVPQYGGVLLLAYAANPPNFDFHMGTMGQSGGDVGGGMFESLYTLDSNYMPRPVLAESHEVSDDGLVYHIKLREGIKFHNGKEMTAEDAAASINRALANLPTPPELVNYLESVEATDKYTVTFRLHTPTGDFFWFLFSNTLSVIPRELCEKYPNEHIPDMELAGTGPYYLKEKMHDRLVHFVRFPDYKSPEGEPDGWAGKKHAYVDEMIFYIVPDQAVRTMGVEIGQYHYAQGIEYGDFERVDSHPRMRAVPVMPSAIYRAVTNHKYGPTRELKIRQAALAAIDAEELMRTVYHFPQLYRLESSKMVAESKWHTTAGSEYFNQNDPEKAKALLKEAGYNNEKIVVIGMTEYEFLRNGAIIFAKQLEDAGFNVELLLSDQGTFISRILSQDGWNFAVTVGADEAVAGTPTNLAWTRDVHIGWWEGETPRKKELGRLLRSETDFDKRYAIWEELVELSYTEASRIMFGTSAYCAAINVDSEGWFDTTFQMPVPRFWNIWLRQ